MLSGDGYVVRVRPRLARLTAAQALGLCAAAEVHGAGLIDLTNRANIQIRGVTEAAWPGLIADLERLDLLDPDAETETRRNIVVAPFWIAGDDTQRLGHALMARLQDLPALPPKTGFALDAGAGPVLGGVSADFRIERGASGALILRAEGRASGTPLRPGGEIDALIQLAHWFVDSGGSDAGRMARHAAPLPAWAEPTEA
ncbi:MAG: cobalamin biosynthesis protein CobG, partial [Pararhodobacter sp.]|nr:cobalamin biosynthesis protein CobG [Pararhodobacter sp.]